jgi:hypothetical protein
MKDLELYRSMKRTTLATAVPAIGCALAAVVMIELRAPSLFLYLLALLAVPLATFCFISDIRRFRYVQDQCRAGIPSTELLIELTSDVFANPRAHSKEVWAQRLLDRLSTLMPENFSAEDRKALERTSRNLKQYRIATGTKMDLLKKRLEEIRQ